MPSAPACRLCGRGPVSAALGVCLSCIRGRPREALALASEAHARLRERFGLPAFPPRERGGVRCGVCANACRLGEGGRGYCGLRRNEGGRIVGGDGVLHTYYDPLPTNCCAAWHCGARGGLSLAVFAYGCSFDCLFCQNHEHKLVGRAPSKCMDAFVTEAARAKCVCSFGGTPEPQLPFLVEACELMLANGRPRVCWEWNGTGAPELVRRAAGLSRESGGTVKFDLKAQDPVLHEALTGRPNRRVLENFRLVAREVGTGDVLTATTLLVPGYVGPDEVERIARFIAGIDPSIPYSLLAFHPDHAMADLPRTGRAEAEACLAAARAHLERVHLGNAHLLS